MKLFACGIFEVTFCATVGRVEEAAAIAVFTVDGTLPVAGCVVGDAIHAIPLLPKPNLKEKNTGDLAVACVEGK